MAHLDNNLESFPMTMLPLNDRYQVEINHFKRADNCHLFNEASYFKLHANLASDHYCQLVNVANQKVYATIAFYQSDEGCYVSPLRGTFGGISINIETDIKMIESFVGLIIAYLIANGAIQILIKQPPFSHDLPFASVMTNILLRQNFMLENHELNYDLRVNTNPFEEKLSSGNRKRVRKCVREGLIADSVDLSDIASVYEVIKYNRERKGFFVSMTLEQLENMASRFSSKVFLFAVWENSRREKMLASAVCLALSDSIFYVFYWGDVAGVETYSPITLLASEIYAFCQNNNYQILDVGTSTLNAEPNYGLIQFKKGLGFTESLKPNFIWNK